MFNKSENNWIKEYEANQDTTELEVAGKLLIEAQELLTLSEDSDEKFYDEYIDEIFFSNFTTADDCDNIEFGDRSYDIIHDLNLDYFNLNDEGSKLVSLIDAKNAIYNNYFNSEKLEKLDEALNKKIKSEFNNIKVFDVDSDGDILEDGINEDKKESFEEKVYFKVVELLNYDDFDNTCYVPYNLLLNRKIDNIIKIDNFDIDGTSRPHIKINFYYENGKSNLSINTY